MKSFFLAAVSTWSLIGTDALADLCANEHGIFIGLASDESVYDSVPGSALNETSREQQWKLVDEYDSGPRNSFSGQYLQVLPDERRSYPSRGMALTDPSQLSGTPYVKFRLQVASSGWHTLFLRWTGGDMVGGGDSLFVTMRSTKKKRFLSGQRTLKPKTVPVSTNLRTYAGCCYNASTHACPCVAANPVNDDCNFIDREKAASFGVQCPVGPGAMEFVDSPRWYLFAGQDVGNVMDFDAEPWDATCEAEGSNTYDSGSDFASWNLAAGAYELHIYAREDGTALDAIYVAGPKARAPALLKRFVAGDSTSCKQATNHSSVAGTVFLALVGCSMLVATAFFARTQRGTDFLLHLKRIVRKDGLIEELNTGTYRELHFQETI